MFKKTLAALLAALFLLMPFNALGGSLDEWNMSCRYKTSREAYVYSRSMYGASYTYTRLHSLPAGSYINVISDEKDGKRMILYYLNGQEAVGWLDADAYAAAVKTVTGSDGTVYSLPEAAWGSADAVGRFLSQYYTGSQVQDVLNIMNAQIAASVPVQSASWTCPVCGKTDNTESFCPRCGTSVSVASQGSAAPAVPAAQVGDLLLLGGYAGEELLWQVLAVSNGQALLLSRYGLERSCFNTNCAGQTWSNSTVRKWLNGEFYSQAFSPAEADAIQVTHVNESEEQASRTFAPKRIGPDTDDKLFLLSYAELMNYVPNTRDRQCVPTTHALYAGCNYSDTVYLDGQPASWWWLRSPAYKNNALVVNASGVVEACMISQTYGVVRPALWVDLAVLGQNGELAFGTAAQRASFLPSATADPASRIARSVQVTPTPTPGIQAPTTAPSKAPTASWQTVLRAFITNGGYLTASGSTVFDSARENIRFTLHDMDWDGTPELLIQNGFADASRAAVYAYKFSGNTFRYLGQTGKGDCLLFFYPDVPGVLCSNTANGLFTLDLYAVQRNAINEKRVMETLYTDESCTTVRSSWQDPDFFESITNAGVSLDPWSLETISALGWEAFFAVWKS